MSNKEVFVSLRGDLSSLLWSGIRLQPEVDVLFRMERLSGTSRLIHATLTKPKLHEKLDLIAHRDFDIGRLGHDFERLETPQQEMMAVAKHFEGISASLENAAVRVGVMLLGESLPFCAAIGIMGRWDWFIDPQEMRPDMKPLSVPLPVAASL